jgi:hypothetical protein
MKKAFISTEDVIYEGCSTINHEDKSFDVGGQHYCSIECLIIDIKEHLGLDKR